MAEVASDPQRKAVCRVLTATLKESPVAASVDPKAFFMMLNTNYSALVVEGHIDLGPIFDALAPNAPEEALLPLFAKFEQRAAELQLEPRLPPALSHLQPDVRNELRARYEAQRGLTATPPAAPDSANDETGDFERRVVNTFVQGFRASPLGQRMDPSQLAYFMGSQIHELLAAGQLRVEPIVEALRQQGVNDSDIYVGLALAGRKLQTLDITVVEPKLDVRPEIRSQLVKQAQTRDVSNTRARAEAERHREEERKKHLEEFELPAKKGPPGRARAIRIGLMVTAIVAIGAFGWLTRPNRQLGTKGFMATIPLKSAQLVDGAFSGVIAWESWSHLPVEEQKRRAEAFESLLKERGLFADFQIRGPDDQVLAVPIEGAFRASPRLYSDFVEPSARRAASAADEEDTSPDGDEAASPAARSKAGKTD